MASKRNLSNEPNIEGTIALRTRSKRKKSASDPLKNMPNQSPPSKEEEKVDEQECGICLDPVKTRGVLDSCDHTFCFSCIMKWTKRSSNCPHCKREVLKITKSDSTGKKLSSHNVKRRNLKDTLDREEFQQRSRQVYSSGNRRRAYAFIDDPHYSSFGPHSSSMGGINTDVTRHLFTMHQMIRDNMNSVSSSLRGLQDNLNNLRILNGNMVPLGMSLCNFPGLTNVNVTVNGFPQPEFYPPMMPNADPPLRYHQEMPAPQMAALPPRPHNQMNYYVPFPVLPGAPLFPPEMAQAMDNLNHFGQTQLQTAVDAQQSGIPPIMSSQASSSFASRSSSRPRRGPNANFGSFPQ